MNTSPTRRWLARALRATAAGILIATLLGSANDSLDSYAYTLLDRLGERIRSGLGENARYFPFLDSIEPVEVRTMPTVEAKHVYQRTTTLNARGDGFDVVYDLYTDKGDPLYDLIQKTVARPVTSWSAEDRQIAFRLFGLVLLDRRSAGYEQPELEVEDVSSIAHFRLRSPKLSYEDPDSDESAPSRRVSLVGGLNEHLDVSEVVVNTEGVRVVPVGVVPRSQELNRTHFTDLQSYREGIQFDLVPLASREEEVTKPISYTLGRFNGGDYQMIQPLLLGIFYSLPFILFLRLRRHPELAADSAVADFFGLSLLILILYSGVSLLRCLIDIVYGAQLYKLHDRLPAARIIGDPGTGLGALLVLFVAALWPRMVRRWERARKHSPDVDTSDFLKEPRPRAAWLTGSLALLLWVAFWAVLSVGLGTMVLIYWLPGAPLISGVTPLDRAAAPLCLVALYASCAWLLYELSGRRLAAFTAVAAALSMVVFLFLDTVTFVLWLRPFFAALLLVPFAFSFARITYPALKGRLFADAWDGRRRAVRLAAYAGAFVLAFLLVWPEQGLFRSLATFGLVFSAAWALGRLWVFALLAVLLRALGNLSSKTASVVELTPPARAAGEVLALAFFFLPAQQWLYVPVVFLLGYVLLKRWIFDPQPPQAAAESKEQLRRAVRDTISLNDAVRGLRLRRKEMVDKLGKGEAEYEDYAKRVESLDDVVEEKRRVMLESRTGGATALRYGPAASPWERAKIFAWYGFLFALPWTIIFVNNITERPAPADNVGLLALLTSAATTLSQWPLYGLFLGYFYPHVRGSNGILKGLYFFIFIFVPMLAANAVANPTDATAWATFALWALQLFIQCMLLGFVTGDYETLRRAGLGWRHLIDVHNLGSLAAWGSSLLVAVGAAVTTLFTSGAASLISSGLNVLLPAALPHAPTPGP
jgi:hypothetical protein